MLDLKIDKLRLDIQDAGGQEHRIRPIVLRAVDLMAERLSERAAAAERPPGDRDVAGLSAPPVRLNLDGMSDEQAADAIAGALLAALALKLDV